MHKKIIFSLFFLVISCTSCGKATHLEQLPPLLKAIIAGNENEVSTLIKKGNDVNVTDTGGRTALMYSVGVFLNDSERYMLRDNRLKRSLENMEIVKLLLNNGAKIEAVGQNGESALLTAVYNGRRNSVALLIHKGANVNVRGATMTPLMLAAYHCFLDIEQVLLEAGANPDLKDRNGKTAGEIAENNNCIEGAKLIRSFTSKK